MHAFGTHAFGMPVFSGPQIPVRRAGDPGPAFLRRPVPAGAGLGGATGCCPPLAGGLGTIALPSWDQALDALGLRNVARGAVGQLTAKVRAEAAAGATAALAPRLRTLYLLGGAGVALGGLSLVLGLARRGGR